MGTGMRTTASLPADIRVGRGMSWSAQIPPPGGWRLFKAGSPFNKPVPKSPSIHPSSAAMITKITGWGDPTDMELDAASSATAGDWQFPIYYSQPTDPLFTIAKQTTGFDSDHWGVRVRIPQKALPAKSGDAHLAVIDNKTGIEYFLWKTASTVAGATLTALPKGGGTIYARGLGKHNLSGDGLKVGTGDANAAGWSSLAGVVRLEEMMLGEIRHALDIVVNSTDGTFVAPASGLGSSGDPVNAPPMGARLWLDMADGEIGALAKPHYVKTVLKAFAHYGAYIGDTSGSGSWEVRFQSEQTYFTGRPRWRQWATDQGVNYSASRDAHRIQLWNAGVTWANKLKVLDWNDPDNY